MTISMKGKRGLVMGVANDHSIAWGIAKAMHEAGAELAFTYQGEAFGKRLAPLAAQVGSDFMVDVDVTDEASMDAAFQSLKDKWGTIDFVVHAIAYSDKNELAGRFINTTRENFKNSMTISCYSLIDVARRAADMMPEGGTILTLTYQGSNRVTPFYNVMGVAKAALEASVRYLAAELGAEKQVRVNAISAGPIRTLASSAIGGILDMIHNVEEKAPLRRTVTQNEVGNTAAFLLSDLSSGISGQTIYVDAGYCINGM